jgi:phenylpropionate dioxygenase-like ring-hydroxylating dioxygenase large terminal subunit
MLVTREKVLRKLCFAVVPIEKLDDGPFPFNLLGEKIVLWKDSDGNPCAIRDRCCHRNGKLSKDLGADGNIVCGYHGWSYNRFA